MHEYIRGLANWHGDDRVVIRVFANARGLAKASRVAGIVRDEDQVYEFITGLSSSHPLTSFTDAGGAKEAADSKMRGKLFSLPPHHC